MTVVLPLATSLNVCPGPLHPVPGHGAALPLVEEEMLAETSNGVIALLKAVLTQVPSKENDICDHPFCECYAFPFLKTTVGKKKNPLWKFSNRYISRENKK